MKICYKMKLLPFLVLWNAWVKHSHCVSSQVWFVWIHALSQRQWKWAFLLCIRGWTQSTSWHLLALVLVVRAVDKWLLMARRCPWNWVLLCLSSLLSLKLHCNPQGGFSQLLKIEGIGQMHFSTDQLLLKQSKNMTHKYRPPPLHLWASPCSSLFLKGCLLAGATIFPWTGAAAARA